MNPRRLPSGARWLVNELPFGKVTSAVAPDSAVRSSAADRGFKPLACRAFSLLAQAERKTSIINVSKIFFIIVNPFTSVN